MFSSSSVPHQTGTATSSPENKQHPSNLKKLRKDEKTNEQIVKQLLEQLQESREPTNLEKMNITNVMLWMKKQAYEETTIKKTAKLLRHLQNNTNTQEPDQVKLYIARKNVSNGYKQNLIEAYSLFLKSIDKKWKQPFYQRYDKKRRAPKEQLLDFMIDHLRLEMAVKLAIEKDLGTRPIETTWLKVNDIDLTSGTVSITGAKHTIGREGKLKAKTLDFLKQYITRKNLKPNDRLFSMKSDNMANNYRKARNRLAKKYKMPELNQICLYDFRRFKGTRTYHLSGGKTLEVMQILGHKDMRSTLKYITTEATITWIPVKCTTDEEIQQAIKDDCILVGHENGVWYFKKPA